MAARSKNDIDWVMPTEKADLAAKDAYDHAVNLTKLSTDGLYGRDLPLRIKFIRGKIEQNVLPKLLHRPVELATPCCHIVQILVLRS